MHLYFKIVEKWLSNLVCLVCPWQGIWRFSKKCFPELPANSGHVFSYFLNNMVRSTLLWRSLRLALRAEISFQRKCILLFLNDIMRSTRIGQPAKQCPPATTMFSIFMGTNLPIHGRPFLGFVSTPCCLFMTRSFCIFKTTVSFLILTDHFSAVCETTMSLFPARLRRLISSPL